MERSVSACTRGSLNHLDPDFRTSTYNGLRLTTSRPRFLDRFSPFLILPVSCPRYIKALALKVPCIRVAYALLQSPFLAIVPEYLFSIEALQCYVFIYSQRGKTRNDPTTKWGEGGSAWEDVSNVSACMVGLQEAGFLFRSETWTIAVAWCLAGA